MSSKNYKKANLVRSFKNEKNPHNLSDNEKC